MSETAPAPVEAPAAQEKKSGPVSEKVFPSFPFLNISHHVHPSA
mgnify:CR=1 FL=1